MDSAGPLKLFDRDYAIVVAQWVQFTERQRCLKLKDKFIFDFMKAIPPPLGFAGMSDIELQKHVIKMNIKSESGWIYFNELLYRILRNQYGKFTLNKNMQIRELITQYRLFNLTMTQITDESRQATDLQEKFFRKVGSSGLDTVNPFLTFMYYRISFQAWRKYMKKHQRREGRQEERAERVERRKTFGIDARLSSAEDTAKSEDLALYEVEIDVEHYSEWTVSSDENLAETPIARAGPAFADATSPKNVLNGQVMTAEKSRQIHRRGVKRRQTLQAVKFGASEVHTMFKAAAAAHRLHAH